MPLKDINRILDDCDLIVGQPITYRETVRETYARVHHIKDMDLMREYIADYSPEYLDAFDEAMSGRTTIYCNMLAAKREALNAYMTWVTPLLDYAYRNIDTSRYDDYNKRLVGFIAERLFNVWLIRHADDYRVSYLPYNMLATGRLYVLRSELFALGLMLWRKIRG